MEEILIDNREKIFEEMVKNKSLYSLYLTHYFNPPSFNYEYDFESEINFAYKLSFPKAFGGATEYYIRCGNIEYFQRLANGFIDNTGWVMVIGNTDLYNEILDIIDKYDIKTGKHIYKNQFYSNKILIAENSSNVCMLEKRHEKAIQKSESEETKKYLSLIHI